MEVACACWPAAAKVPRGAAKVPRGLGTDGVEWQLRGGSENINGA